MLLAGAALACWALSLRHLLMLVDAARSENRRTSGMAAAKGGMTWKSCDVAVLGDCSVACM